MELHYLNNSRAMRVVWLLEELDLACDIVHYQRHRRSHRAPPALQAIHPLGKSPVLIDEGRTWAESAVI
nr:glutathione S-transferase [Neisseriaceae bacterium]